MLAALLAASIGSSEAAQALCGETSKTSNNNKTSKTSTRFYRTYRPIKLMRQVLELLTGSSDSSLPRRQSFQRLSRLCSHSLCLCHEFGLLHFLLEANLSSPTTLFASRTGWGAEDIKFMSLCSVVSPGKLQCKWQV